MIRIGIIGLGWWGKQIVTCLTESPRFRVVAGCDVDTNRAAPFAVVITDLGMPYVDGRKVAAAIKRESAATPVILLTGWGQRLEAEGDMPASVDFVLAKPPKIAELRGVLAKVGA